MTIAGVCGITYPGLVIVLTILFYPLFIVDTLPGIVISNIISSNSS
jgi:hypothetical protein